MINDMSKTFQFDIGGHNQNKSKCDGKFIITYTDDKDYLSAKDPDCGPLPGDSAVCNKCGQMVGYDGNFWT